MDLLLTNEEERCRIQVYNEYLKKIPQLLQQLETVETMYEKAVMEEKMIPACGPENKSSQIYLQRLVRTKEQCMIRAADIRQQCRLIFALKEQIEHESAALRMLLDKA